MLGQHLVLFRDGEGVARALDAACPHRGANLSGGRVIDGCLACPYHGWRFDGAGQCTVIPSNPEGRTVPSGHRTTAYAVAEQQGFIWVCLAQDAITPPPQFPQLDDKGLRAFCYETVVPLPFDWWVENAIDVAHVPFVHPATYGAQSAVVPSYAVETREDRLGFTARTTTRQKYSLFARLLHKSASHFDMRIVVTHWMAGCTVFDIDLGKGKRQVLLFLATPEDDSSTRVFNIVLRNYLLIPFFGDLVGRWFLKKVLDEDIALAKRSLSGGRMLSAAADEPALEFMRLLKHWSEHG
jgi:phenylpropionate dioxygenase-like ring-hydroxylating dioxygenase large terminal subunit